MTNQNKIIATQKTYLGKTAGGWLKNSKIAKFGGSSWHPTIMDFPADESSVHVDITDDGEMIVCSYNGIDCRLTLSGRAYDKLNIMLNECNLKMLAGE